MAVWWELYDKYEQDLVKLDPWEDDDEDLLKAAEKLKENELDEDYEDEGETTNKKAKKTK